MKDHPQSIVIDGVTYAPQESKTTGNRAVIVVDRGWIFAGDVEQKDGYITLTRAVWVFRWESVGFDGVIANPSSSSVKLRKMSNPVSIPEGSEIFRVPVAADWGL